jgi:hypothetical protein
MALTPKQEAFAQEIASGKSQADAYRIAFNAGKMKPETIYKRASELMANGEITGRVQELREPVVQKVQLTLEAHLTDLQKLRNMAVKKEQYSAAISAEIARGRAAGLYVEKSEVTITPYEEQLKALGK